MQYHWMAPGLKLLAALVIGTGAMALGSSSCRSPGADCQDDDECFEGEYCNGSICVPGSRSDTTSPDAVDSGGDSREGDVSVEDTDQPDVVADVVDTSGPIDTSDTSEVPDADVPVVPITPAGPLQLVEGTEGFLTVRMAALKEAGTECSPVSWQVADQSTASVQQAGPSMARVEANNVGTTRVVASCGEARGQVEIEVTGPPHSFYLGNKHLLWLHAGAVELNDPLSEGRSVIWARDQSGNDRDFKGKTGDNGVDIPEGKRDRFRPDLRDGGSETNNLPYLYFDGAEEIDNEQPNYADHLVLDSAQNEFALSSVTFVFVARADASRSDQKILNSRSGGNFQVLITESMDRRSLKVQGDFAADVVLPGRAGQWRVMTVVFFKEDGAAKWIVRADGEKVVEEPISAPPSYSYKLDRIGHWDGPKASKTESLKGGVAEVHAFEGKVPESDRIAIEQHLMNKYGISLEATP